jgi:hypothetical protein
MPPGNKKHFDGWNIFDIPKKFNNIYLNNSGIRDFATLIS